MISSRFDPPFIQHVVQKTTIFRHLLINLHRNIKGMPEMHQSNDTLRTYVTAVCHVLLSSPSVFNSPLLFAIFQLIAGYDGPQPELTLFKYILASKYPSQSIESTNIQSYLADAVFNQTSRNRFSTEHSAAIIYLSLSLLDVTPLFRNDDLRILDFLRWYSRGMPMRRALKFLSWTLASASDRRTADMTNSLWVAYSP